MKNLFKNILFNHSRKEWILIGFILLFAITTTTLLISKRLVSPKHHHKHISEKEANKETVWTCSMHPQIKLPEFGKCPICFMDLIAIQKDENFLSDTQIKMSAKAIKLAKINTIKTRKEYVKRDLFLSGKVMTDKTREQKVAARFPGRIEKMFISYPGIKVKKGDHLYEIYSPEIFSAHQALIQSKENLQRAEKQENDVLLKSSQIAFKSAVEKLRLYGMTKQQIDIMTKERSPRTRITVYSPYEGVVMKKMEQEGAYIEEGTVVYEITDLSKLWLMFDVYESDLQWVKYGEEMTIDYEALPGWNQKARIAFIEPFVNEKTRSAMIRLTVDNSEDLLKPGMIAKGHLATTLTSMGKHINNYLSDKWISPMHPEIIKDRPGYCDVCGMKLVKAESLGYINDKTNPEEKKIVIPATSPLITGKRAIVYVENKTLKDKSKIYEAREVKLGPKAGNLYTVLDGIDEGEKVVVEGVFKIDSAMQIVSKSSMMTYSDESKMNEKSKVEKLSKIHLEGQKDFLDAYLQTQEALAEDNFKKAQKKIKNLNTISLQLHSPELKQDLGEIKFHIKKMKNAANIVVLRKMFKPFSTKVIHLLQFVQNPPTEINVFYCSMYDKGARWLGRGNIVNNPYHGSSMLRCGNNEGHPVKKADF